MDSSNDTLITMHHLAFIYSNSWKEINFRIACVKITYNSFKFFQLCRFRELCGHLLSKCSLEVFTLICDKTINIQYRGFRRCTNFLWGKRVIELTHKSTIVQHGFTTEFVWVIIETCGLKFGSFIVIVPKCCFIKVCLSLVICPFKRRNCGFLHWLK